MSCRTQLVLSLSASFLFLAGCNPIGEPRCVLINCDDAGTADAGGSDAGIADAGSDAGIDAGIDAGVSFCARMQAGSDHLVQVLAACPMAGDSNITAFNRATCDAQTATKCTSTEQSTLISLSVCEQAIASCVMPADHARVVGEVSACAAGVGSVSSDCITALGN